MIWSHQGKGAWGQVAEEVDSVGKPSRTQSARHPLLR